MDLRVNSGVWGSMFGIPCIVADNFLKLADGGHIKVLLYILRNSGRNISTEEISLHTGVVPEKVEEAVNFWQQANVLLAQQAESSIRLAPVQTIEQPAAPVTKSTRQSSKKTAKKQTASPAVQKSTAEVPEQTDTQVSKTVPFEHRLNSASDVANVVRSSSDLSELMSIAESILGVLNFSMQRVLLYIFETLCLKKEVIITLVSYCASINRTDAQYIEQTARNWYDDGINTRELAEQRISEMNVSTDFYTELKNSFKLNRELTRNEKKYADQWREKGYGMGLIMYAYELTVERIQLPRFSYMNAILLRWETEGCTTVEQAQEISEIYRNNKKYSTTDSKKGEFDMDEYKAFMKGI